MSYKEYDMTTDNNSKLHMPKLLRASHLLINNQEKTSEWSTQHSHDFIEIFFINNGSFKFLLNNTFHTVSKGDILIVNPQVEHCEQQKTSEFCEIYILAFNNIKIDFDDNIFHLNDKISSLLFYFKTIFEEMENQQESYEIIAQNLMENLFVFLNRIIRLKTEQSDIKASKKTAVIEQAVNYIEKNYNKKLTIQQLSDNCFVSKCHFIRNFQKQLGSSPLQYINRYRIEISKEALKYTNKSINAICIDIGFSDVNNYIRKFKEFNGLTPLEYRKQFKRTQ